MKYNEFKVGQRIQKKEDEGDGPKWFDGKIVGIKEDHILIDMDDLWMDDEPIQVYADEYDDIRLKNS